jgi:pimeloyl-ACP methyl ester carboxylesterase
MDSLFLEPPGGYLRYLEFPGDNVPVVWIHGLGGAASSDFAPVVASPTLIGHRSLLIDLFGHGYSDGPEVFGYTLDEHAITISQLLDHLSLRGCAVFGHSMGGSIAITLAALRPDLVARLIIAEGNLDPGGGMVSRGIAEQTEREFETTGRGALLGQIFADFGATRGATFRACSPLGLYRSAVGLVEGTQPTMRERLYAFRIPRAYLFGERGLPDPDTERLSSHGIQIMVVPEAGHDMVVDNPAGLAERVAQALQVPAQEV